MVVITRKSAVASRIVVAREDDAHGGTGTSIAVY
jgi:hypothetical protein